MLLDKKIGIRFWLSIVIVGLQANPAKSNSLQQLADKALDCSAISFVMTLNPDPGVSKSETHKGMMLIQIYALFRSQMGEKVNNKSAIESRDKRARTLGLLWDNDQKAVQRMAEDCERWSDMAVNAIKSSPNDPTKPLLNLPPSSEAKPGHEKTPVSSNVDASMGAWTARGRPTPSDMKEFLRRDLKN